VKETRTSWIQTISYKQATGKLKAIYERVKGPHNDIDNILLAHSLRPHTLEGHMAIYKSVLHHNGNRLPTSLLETLGVYVSLLNGCDYCVQHHFAGLKRLLANDARARAIFAAFESGQLKEAFDERNLAILDYAKILTQTPNQLEQAHIQRLRDSGLEDGDILEINQVVAYFSYANCTVLVLGVTTSGDELCLSPNDPKNPENWGHQ